MRGMELEDYFTLLEQRQDQATEATEATEATKAAEPEEGRVVAYFDLDRTLIDGYSLTALAWQQVFNGDMGIKRFCSLGTMFLRYGLKRIDYDDMLRATVADIQGMSENDLRQLSRQAFEVRLADWLYREGDLLIQKHKALGHDVVMVTSATTYQAEPIAAALDIQHVLATTLEIVDGKVAGGVQPCFGTGKVTAARQFAQRSNTRLSNAYFYSDSHDDLPLLNQVGFPVVVNGKPQLSRVGQDNGWIQLQFVEKGRDHFTTVTERRVA